MDEFAQTEHQNELMASLGFTESDLEANRAGVLSEEQRKKYRGESLASRDLGGILAIIGAVLVTGSLVFIWYGTSHTESGTFLIIFLASMPLLGALMYWRRSRKMLRVAQPEIHVEMVEGRIKVRVADDSYTFYDEVYVSGEHRVRLQTSYSAGTMKPGERYRVYYEPHTREALSAEWIGSN